MKVKPQRLPKRLRRIDRPAGELRRKVRLYATEAAVISLGIHLLLFFFASSLVVLNVVRVKAVAFRGEKVERPELEDRAAQLPVKIDEFQRSGAKPRMASRIVTTAERPVAFPATGLPEMKFESEGRVAETLSLSSQSLPGGLDFGVTGVNFFGARSTGEKMVFILDASKQMMEDAKGGYYTYKFAKDKIHAMVDAMPAATLFNVMVYNDSSVDMFRPQPVPATPAARDELKGWLEPINSNPGSVGQVSSTYRPAVTYQSDIGSGARHWLKAVQAAMEQTADNIFVLCAGFGQFSARQGQGEAPKYDETAMAIYREKLAAVNEKAKQALSTENSARAAKGLPPKIIYGWRRYVEEELRLVFPEHPPAINGGGGQRPIEPEVLVLDHLDAIWAAQYTPKELMPPRIHFVYLIAADTSLQRGYQDVVAMEKTAEAYRGNFEYLRGAKTMKNLIRYHPDF